jgi:peroxisomal 2,4-dienoyl-CoA reductase
MVALGANACIIGRNVEKTENMAKDIATVRPGAKVIGIGAVDVRKPELLQSAADRCVKELGSLDFVIAGAAGNFLATIDQISPNAMKSVIDIDVLGSYNTVKATLPYLVKSAAQHRTDGRTPPPNGTGGRIIFVSATLHYAGTPLQSHVSVAKAGVDAMAMSVAIEQGPRGVTSNVIAPGPIADTEGMERLSKKGSREKSYKAVPIGRYGTVKEIADATVYLFSDAGNFVNGETLVGKLRYSDCEVKGANERQLMVVSGIQLGLRMGSSIPTFCCLETPWKVWLVARRKSQSCKSDTNEINVSNWLWRKVILISGNGTLVTADASYPAREVGN